MNKTSKTYLDLYQRDVDRLLNELEAIPDALLWEVPEGVTNSSGVLVQHVVGNLSHYLGTEVGKTGYVRTREREFSNTGISKKELATQVEDLKDMLADVFSSLDEQVLQEEYPGNFPYKASLLQAIIHLYGHLNYHLGQVNYMRRILEKKAESK